MHGLQTKGIKKNYKRKPKEIKTSSLVDGVSSALPADSNDAVSSVTVSSSSNNVVGKNAPASANPRQSSATKKGKPVQASTGTSVQTNSRHKTKEANSSSSASAAIESESNESANEYGTGNEGLEDHEVPSEESSSTGDSSSDGNCFAFT